MQHSIIKNAGMSVINEAVNGMNTALDVIVIVVNADRFADSPQRRAIQNSSNALPEARGKTESLTTTFELPKSLIQRAPQYAITPTIEDVSPL
jgi:hypothetical protein